MWAVVGWGKRFAFRVPVWVDLDKLLGIQQLATKAQYSLCLRYND